MMHFLPSSKKALKKNLGVGCAFTRLEILDDPHLFKELMMNSSLRVTEWILIL